MEERHACREIMKQHLLAGQCYGNHIPKELRALILYFGVFVCYFLASAISVVEEGIDDALTIAMFGLIIGMVSAFGGAIVEFSVSFVSSLVRMIVMGGLVLVLFAGGMFYALDTNAEQAEICMYVFLMALGADLMVFQTIIALVKTFFFKSS